MPRRGAFRGNFDDRKGRGFNNSGDRFRGQSDEYGGYRPNFNREGHGISKRGSFGSKSRGGRSSWPPGPHRGGGSFTTNNRQSLKPLGFSIKVMNAQKEDQMELMQSLEQKVGSTLNADNVNVNDNHVEFVVTSESIAYKLEKLSGSLKNSEGRKMAILKKPWFGDRSLPAADEEKLKELLNKHYNHDMKFLDLSNFLEKQEAPGVGLKKFFIAQKFIATSVCKIIGAYIPQLEILDLSGNGLFNMFPYSDLPVKAPNLTKLNLSNNRMSDISNLEPVRKLKLTEIILEGNPLCRHYKDQSTYVKDVHKRFPNVQMLDMHAVKATIGFDLDAAVVKTLPKFLGNVVHDAGVKSVVYRFLEQYFGVFDKDDRGNFLMDAYDTNATMCMSMFFGDQSSREKFAINKMFKHTRNLTKCMEERTREQCLFKGKFKILSCLSDMPHTEHDLTSFRIDMMLETQKLVIFMVNGVLREKGNSDVYSFSRTFACKPHKEGLQITNETIHFRPCLEWERRRAFANPGPTPSNSPVVTTTVPAQPEAAGTSSSSGPVPQQLSESEKEALVRKFSSESGLNLKWTLECLNANNWDYQTSAIDFQRAKNAGDIPAEAYVST